MTTIEPLQLLNLFRLFIGLLLALLVLWSGCGFLTVGDIVMPLGLLPRLLFLGMIVLGTAGLTWALYRRYYHAVLKYDEIGYELQQGRNRWAGRWTEFSDVSLFHKGRGQYVVRLYTGEEQFEEIPVSTLKLDPSEFRFLVMKYRGS